MRAGPLSPKNSGLLLTSAALVDMLLLLLFVNLALPKLTQVLRKDLSFIDPDFYGVLLFSILLPVHWVLTELLLAGRSPGRMLLGLQMQHKSGQPLGWHRRMFRTINKLAFLGLGGLNPVGESQYDKISGTQWLSPLCPPPPRPMRDWELVIATGSLRGQRVALKRFKSGRVKIGREQGWSNLRLGAEDTKVSRRHCVLFAKSGRLYLADGDGQGTPSSSGTYLDGRQLAKGETRAIGAAKGFVIGDVEIRIVR